MSFWHCSGKLAAVTATLWGSPGGIPHGYCVDAGQLEELSSSQGELVLLIHSCVSTGSM